MAHSNTGNSSTPLSTCDWCRGDIARGTVIAIDGGRTELDQFFCSTACVEAHDEAVAQWAAETFLGPVAHMKGAR